MEKAWKMYVTDNGLNSYQNETMELRDFYRVIILLQSNFKERMSEKQRRQRSLFYHVTRSLHRADEQKEYEGWRDIYDENSRTYYIDGRAICIGWCACSGISITAQKPEGNRKIVEIADFLQDHHVWWNQ